MAKRLASLMVYGVYGVSGLLAGIGGSANAMTINISLDNDPGKLDPTRSSMIAERMVYQSIFDKLLDLDETGKIIPMLAQRWTISDDKKTYTLFLHKGVKFQDGVHSGGPARDSYSPLLQWQRRIGCRERA